MKGIAQFNKPDDVEISITVIATIGEWKRVYEDLQNNSYPSTELRLLLSKMIQHAKEQSEETVERAT